MDLIIERGDGESIEWSLKSSWFAWQQPNVNNSLIF